MTAIPKARHDVTFPFPIMQHLGGYGRHRQIDDRRHMFGDSVEARFHRVVTVTPPVFLLDAKMLGKMPERPWWIREYADMSEAFMREVWNKPLDLKQFRFKEGFLYQDGRRLTVKTRFPRNFFPHILTCGVERAKLFTFGEPFSNKADRDLFLGAYDRSLGFPPF